jgi:hypothetical protein
LKGIKIKKNLGSLIRNVSDFSLEGYTVMYWNGDVCRTDADGYVEERYSSEVRYICNNATDDIGWPEFIEESECHYKFQWRSKLACSICSNT